MKRQIIALQKLRILFLTEHLLHSFLKLLRNCIIVLSSSLSILSFYSSAIVISNFFDFLLATLLLSFSLSKNFPKYPNPAAYNSAPVSSKSGPLSAA